VHNVHSRPAKRAIWSRVFPNIKASKCRPSLLLFWLQIIFSVLLNLFSVSVGRIVLRPNWLADEPSRGQTGPTPASWDSAKRVSAKREDTNFAGPAGQAWPGSHQTHKILYYRSSLNKRQKSCDRCSLFHLLHRNDNWLFTKIYQW